MSLMISAQSLRVTNLPIVAQFTSLQLFRGIGTNLKFKKVIPGLKITPTAPACAFFIFRK